MPNVIVVYWRDMPAQVIVGKGRRAAKAPLPERFEQAIDRAAMKVGAKDDDAYLSGFHKVDTGEVDGAATGLTDAEIAAARATEIDTTYDADRLKTLIANDGWETTRAAAE